MTRASRKTQQTQTLESEAQGVRADPYGSELLLSFARFAVGVEPINSTLDRMTLRLGRDQNWLRLAVGKSNSGPTDVQVIFERVDGAVEFVDMSLLPLGAEDEDAPEAPPNRTPANLGFAVGETVTKSAIAKKLFGLGPTTKPNARQQDQGDRLARVWHRFGWANASGTGWKIVANGVVADGKAPPPAEAS